jgi:NAD+ diphosphatase
MPLGQPVHDRLNQHRNDEDWLRRAWDQPDTLALPLRSGEVWVHDSTEALCWLAPHEVPAGAERLLLGAGAGGTLRFAALVGDEFSLPQAHPVGLRALGDTLVGADAGLLLHALALGNWHEQHQRCSRCGAPTTAALGGHLRRCPDGCEHYPRTDPAVIALVVDGDDRALLGHQARWPDRWFSTLAGFVEAGESAEQALFREIEEEVGIRIDSARYLGSQPWPFPSSLMLGYRAAVAGTGPQPQPDGLEIAEARWFSRAQLREEADAGLVRLPPRLSIASKLINDWLDG